jgi:hypothetical protein
MLTHNEKIKIKQKNRKLNKMQKENRKANRRQK